MLSKQLDLSKFRSWLIVKRGIGQVCADGYCGSVKRFIKATGITSPTEDDAIKIMNNASGKLGFYGATAVTQQVLATGAGATVDNVISFLQTVGLCKQS